RGHRYQPDDHARAHAGRGSPRASAGFLRRPGETEVSESAQPEDARPNGWVARRVTLPGLVRQNGIGERPGKRLISGARDSLVQVRQIQMILAGLGIRMIQSAINRYGGSVAGPSRAERRLADWLALVLPNPAGPAVVEEQDGSSCADESRISSVCGSDEPVDD